MSTSTKVKNVRRAFVNACLKNGFNDADVMVSLVRDISKGNVTAYKAVKSMRSGK